MIGRITKEIFTGLKLNHKLWQVDSFFLLDMHTVVTACSGLGLEMKEKTHASSPSTSGKTHEKTSVIQTRRLQFDVWLLTPGLHVNAAYEWNLIGTIRQLFY